MSSEYILKVEDLKTYFTVTKGSQKNIVKAVDGVSFAVRHGETVGLVGESGCGKSTIGRTIMRFNDPTAGKIYLDGDDITTCDMAPYRKKMQMVFQDPYSSLDPRMSVNDIVGEPLDIQFPKMSAKERSERIIEQLHLVGINSEQLSRFPADKRDALIGVLAQDPRPRYQTDASRVYGLEFGGYEVKFSVNGQKMTVTDITEKDS